MIAVELIFVILILAALCVGLRCFDDAAWVIDEAQHQVERDDES